MSTPSTDYNQMLAYLQVWRDILDKAATTTAALAANMPFTPPGMPFVPPGMPFVPPGMPPMLPGMPPTVPLAPADYAQQLFGYLQAWRQSLEQMSAAGPAMSRPSTTPAADDYATRPPVRPVPPPDPVGSKRRDVTNTSLTSEPQVVMAPDESSTANRNIQWPPYNVAPSTVDGSQAPDGYVAGGYLEPGTPDSQSLFNAPSESRFNAPQSPQVLRPPVYDYGNQWLPKGYKYEPASPAGTPAGNPPASPARSITPEAAAPRPVGSSFLGVTRRVTPDAVRMVAPKSLFKSPGQTLTP